MSYRVIALAQTPPDVGSFWIHRLGGRICKVVGNRITVDGGGKHIQLVEFKYRRTARGLGRNRSTPTQTMPLEQWRDLFTTQAPTDGPDTLSEGLEALEAGLCPKCNQLMRGKLELDGQTLAMPCRHVLRSEKR